MKINLTLLLLLICHCAFAQVTGPTYNTTSDYKVWGKGSFGKGDNTPTDASAILELGKPGTDKGLLLPRITDTAAVVSPKAGLFVYVPSDEALAYFDGFRWQYVTKGVGIISVSRGNDTLYFELANGTTIPVKMDYYPTSVSDLRYVHYADSAAMLSGYVRTGYRHIDSLILKRAADSTLIDLDLPAVNPEWFGAVPDDGLSDRVAIQAAIDFAGGRRRVLFPSRGQYDIDSTLLVESHADVDAAEAKVFLMNGSDCAMVSNRHKTTPGNMAIVDSAITITGGHWFANGDNQEKFMGDGTPVVGFLFSGVKYLTFSPRRIINTHTYAVFSSNVCYSKYYDLEIDQGAYNPPLHNQDGLHFNGPAHHITVTNSIFKTFDDAVALNCEDVPQGPWLTEGAITDVIISDIVLNETRKGIRMLSADWLMDRIIINDISGTATDNLLEASAYGLGPGNFGDISISNVNVKMQNNIINNEYISFNNRIRSVYVDNVIRKPDNSVRSTITIKPLADIDILQIGNVKTIADTTYDYADILTQSGAIIRRMVVDNYRYIGGKPGKSTAIAINSSTLQTLEIKNSSFDSLLTAVAISNTSIKQLRLSDNSAYKVYNSVFLNASPIADTLHLYGSVMVDTASNAFRTAGFASIGRIKTYLPTVSVPAATATFAPIKYTYSGTQYSLNPISTIDLQTVTNVSGLTTNMDKVTGVNNVKNGLGVERFFSSGVGTVWCYDRGGTNTLQPLLVGGAPVMLNTRVLVGVSGTTTDDASTTLQVKGSFAASLTSTGTNLSLTSAHHTVKLTATGLTITLPSAASAFGGVSGRIYCIINPNGATSTISTYNALAGGTSTTIPANAALWLQSNGTTWDQIK